MNNPLKRLAGLTLAGALAVGSPARAAEPNAIQAIDAVVLCASQLASAVCKTEW